jgi:triphosphoribosyl-dephospho-CoA synthase
VALELLGLAAEQRMLQATGGINTHRGAIFTLGLLCAAAGSAGRPVSDAELRRTLLARWGEALEARRERGANSHGRLAAQRLGLRSAGDEAALGFPALFEHAVPALRQALGQGLNRPDALLQTLFEIMAVLDDTNLAHRGGAAGLGFARDQARAFLAAGGVRRPDAQAHALHIHRSFIARRLSPGGAADLLGAAALVVRLCHGA